MAAITDKFNKAANGTGAYPSVASITANREQGGSVLSCDDLVGWATDTPVHFSTFRLMADGTVDTSTQSDWKGIVNGNTITQMTRIAGAADSGHLVGDKVELNPTIGWLDDLITGILKSHNQDGSLKDGVVQTKNIVDGSITEAKLADKAVTSHNLDWSTLYSSNTVIVPNAGVTISNYFNGSYSQQFTIPTSGKWLLIDAWTGVFHRTTNNMNILRLNIDGTEQLKYAYASEEGDFYWGTSRRSLTGTQKILNLKAGTHTLSTAGNLYMDDTYGPSSHDIILLRVGE